MASSKPLFIMVFAGDCGHCIEFKKTQLQNLQKSLKSEPRVEPLEIHLTSMSESIPKSVDGVTLPGDFHKYVYGFPSFMVLARCNIGKSQIDKSGLAIYGTSVTNNGPVRVPISMPLMEWVSSNVGISCNESQISMMSSTVKKIPTEGSYRIIPKSK